MLVLSRQRDETIMIGDEIEITVVDIRGDKVRLGITAPSKIAVHRKEIYEAIKQENRQASRIDRGDLTAVSPPKVRPAATPRLVVGPQPPAPPVRPQGAPAPGAAPRTVIGSLRAAQ